MAKRYPSAKAQLLAKKTKLQASQAVLKNLKDDPTLIEACRRVNFKVSSKINTLHYKVTASKQQSKK